MRRRRPTRSPRWKNLSPRSAMVHRRPPPQFAARINHASIFVGVGQFDPQPPAARLRKRLGEGDIAMTSEYHVHGIELSPYSVKVRSYFRYKGIPHRWIPRSLDTEGEYQKFAKLPLVPLVVTPENEGIQDSTPIIEHVEALHPEPSIHPSDPVARFISVLLEEFGDEWGNKWMVHYRGAPEADQLSGAGRIARSMMPTADDAQLVSGTAMVRERMVNRVSFVGSNPVTA